jgi:glucan phosphoethanolaminetransferase (alkaline phosphatase superfamily)
LIAQVLACDNCDFKTSEVKMAEDKIIKSGQLTLPRILFLAVCACVIFAIVYFGLLNIGYILLTAVLCVLLFLIAIDYKVEFDKAGVQEQALQIVTTAETPLAAEKATSTAKRVRQKRRANKPAKRRR